MKFGDFVRKKRIQQKMTLRSFCSRYGYDSAYISRLENSKLEAPESEEKLNALALALNIQKESQEWVIFFDLAYISKNEIPKDIKNSASEAIMLLPAFLRTSNNKKVSKDKVEKLIEFLSKR